MKNDSFQIGLIGLAVMGANIARNLASHGIQTVVFNRTPEKTIQFIKKHTNSAEGKTLSAETDLKNFIAALKPPRKIIIMVQAGSAVDEVIRQLTLLLEKNDIIIDCGNSNYRDTERRFSELQEKGIKFVGCGVSGGEEGALKGPSLMPGCEKEAWEKLKPILSQIAAKDFSGNPCITHVGTRGAGHFVKMVHNGIEYGVIQLIAEIYDLLRARHLEADTISKIFEKWNKGALNSYLFEISVQVTRKKDSFHPKEFLINYIKDTAAQKGTGKWTAIEALETNISLPTITEAVFSRYTSSQKEKRTQLEKIYRPRKDSPKATPSQQELETLEQGLYAAMLSCYAQGFELIQSVSKQNNWEVNLAEVARIWEGGCIIRATLLKTLHQAYQKRPKAHIFEIPDIIEKLKSAIPELRKAVIIGIENQVPLPALGSSLNYIEAMTQGNSSANFIQGLRDYFGAHTYERTDQPGTFHTDWNE